MMKHLNDVFRLSLQEMALRRVAVQLWMEPDSLTGITNIGLSSDFYCDHQKHWCKTIQCKILEKVSKFQMPEALSKQMKEILKPIGLEILRWKKFHEDYLSDSSKEEFNFFYVPILEKLCWTAIGTVNYEKTAEKLVSSNVMDIVKCYKLACLYCLEHYIAEFWNKLPEDKKTFFYRENNGSKFVFPFLQFCWPFILKGEEYKLVQTLAGEPKCFYKDMIEYSAYTGNKSAFKYFYQKLPEKKRKACLNIAFYHSIGSGSKIIRYNDFHLMLPKENGSDVTLYILSLMTPEERNEIFSFKSAYVLGCFLDWPYQNVFLDCAETMWTWMQCDDSNFRTKNYFILLVLMEIKLQESDYCLPNFYQNFFQFSPRDFRKFFAFRECSFGTFFSKLFNNRDTETINFILRILDAKDRIKLALSKNMFERFYKFISNDQGDVVEMSIRETGLSEEDKKRLKMAFMLFLRNRDSGQIEWETPKWKRFFEFLDEANARSESKRSSDNETLAEAKKNCVVKKESFI